MCILFPAVNKHTVSCAKRISPVFTDELTLAICHCKKQIRGLEGFCDEYEVFLPGHYFYSKEGKMKRWYSRDWTEYETVKENDAQTVDVKIALEEAVRA